MIGIIDYAAGNVYNVQKAFCYLGAEAIVTNDHQKLKDAAAIVLPGVGAFHEAMQSLNEQGLSELIVQEVRKGKPFFGICLGMQLLMDRSEEGPPIAGLGLVPGITKRLDTPFKIPHMGWNSIRSTGACPLFEGIAQESYVYFVHSFYVQPQDDTVVAATCDYGKRVCAALWQDNLFATQFHPEKSSAVGLMLLQNFLKRYAL